MSAQSLLFDRAAGWTVSKAKAWAQSHGYRYGKVDVTDQYIRIRQFDPKGFKVKRTIPFGRGIRAVVAREEMNSMAKSKKTSHRRRPRRSPRKKAASASHKRRPRRARRARKVRATETRRRRRTVRVEARRASRRRSAPAGYMMEAKRRRRRRRVSEAWRGNPEGHAKAAKKGWRRKKKRASSSRPKRRRSRRVREVAYEASPRRRRRRRKVRRVSSPMMEARRTRRRYHPRRRGLFEAKRGGMGAAEVTVTMLSAGLGFVLADGIDRLIATYNPSAAERPKDKFTSDGAGTLANTLNVAATPNWQRVVAGVGVAAVPAIGSMYIDNPLVRSSVQGLALGAGVSVFRTLWNNVLMPMLIGKDTSVPALQKSYIARLYPAEVAASINKKQNQTAVSSSGSGALSDAPASTPSTGVGAPAADVGPFALAGDPSYPDAAQALRAGVSGDPSYPDAAQALRAGVSGDPSYPSAGQALRSQAGMSAPAGVSEWAPGPPPGPGPGPQAAPHTDPSCGCIGDGDQFLGFIGDAQEDTLFDSNAAAAGSPA